VARHDRARLVATAAALLGVACGGAPRAAEPDPASITAQMIDGEARCGVGSDEREAEAMSPPSSPESSSGAAVESSGDVGPGPIRIAVGATHACALVDGDVWCWGSNDHFELGRVGHYGTPRRVPGLPGGIVRVDAGTSCTCACTSNRALYCWGGHVIGRGDAGAYLVEGVDCAELAVGAETAYVIDESGVARQVVTIAPVESSPLRARAMSVSQTHACLLPAPGDDDVVRCWGRDTYGGVTDGTRHDGVVDVPVTGAERVAVGFGNSCVSTLDAVWCWGGAALSDAELLTSPTPAPDASRRHVIATRRFGPRPVPSVGHATRLAVGRSESCAITDDRSLVCWRYPPSYSRDATHVDPPAIVASNVVEVDIEDGTGCTLDTRGEIRCWGALDPSNPQGSAPGRPTVCVRDHAVVNCEE
jgi:hypothetical protein